MKQRIIAVTGGIGSGKSVVCRMLHTMGYPVYDCDLEARMLMDHSADIKRRIAVEVTTDAVNPDGTLNRPAISKCVFADRGKLRNLNAIVHGAVRAHFSEWASVQTAATLFVETAILYESGFDKLVSEVWEVTAPRELRIERVMKRSGLERSEVESRIAAQSPAERAGHKVIVNDGNRSVITQIFKLLK